MNDATDQLRDKIAARIRRRLGAAPERFPHAAEFFADAAMAVVQPELDRLGVHDAECERVWDEYPKAIQRIEQAEAAAQALRRLLSHASTHLRALCHVGRHDNFGANLSCAACQLAREIDAALGQHDSEDEVACRVCGCTEEAACEGGCHWIPDPRGQGDLCSRCEGAILRVTVEVLDNGDRTVRGVPAGDYAIVAADPCSYTVVPARGGVHRITVIGRVDQPGQEPASPDRPTPDGDPR